MRLIDADALKAYIDAQKGRPFIGCTVGEALKIITDEQPTVTPEPHWIPVTERLPNRDELVLATYKTTSKIHLCKYLDDGSENSWWSYIDDCCAWNNVILAWMPLPESYKGVTE